MRSIHGTPRQTRGFLLIQKRDSFFQEVSFKYIIHNAQEKLFVARHQANEARSVLLVRGGEVYMS